MDGAAAAKSTIATSPGAAALPAAWEAAAPARAFERGSEGVRTALLYLGAAVSYVAIGVF